MCQYFKLYPIDNTTLVYVREFFKYLFYNLFICICYMCTGVPQRPEEVVGALGGMVTGGSELLSVGARI